MSSQVYSMVPTRHILHSFLRVNSVNGESPPPPSSSKCSILMVKLTASLLAERIDIFQYLGVFRGGGADMVWLV